MLKDIAYVNGPYPSKQNEGRFYLSYRRRDGSKRFVSYPKFLVECVLDRELHPKRETVDHIDGDFRNNAWTNLRILALAEHAAQDSQRNLLPVHIPCVKCGTVTPIVPSAANKRHKEGKAGPFCSRQCRGAYAADVRYGRTPPLPPIQYIPKDQWVYGSVQKTGGIRVSDLFRKMGIAPPSEQQLVATFPRHSPSGPTQKKGVCARCGHDFLYIGSRRRKYCSVRCFDRTHQAENKPSKKRLLELVQSIPMTQIGKRYGVTDNAVRKWCSSYGIDPKCSPFSHRQK